MTKIEEMQTQISASLENDKAKIYFKDLVKKPLFGMFVCQKDFDELDKKGMYRFVTDYKLDEYLETRNINLTRIFSINTLHSIKIC